MSAADKTYWDEIALSEGFVARLGDAATPERLEQIKANTMALMKALRQNYLPKAEQARWIEQIKAGEIDPDAGEQRAIVVRDGSVQRFFSPTRVLNQIIEKGKCGEAVFKALLDAADDPCGTPRKGRTTLYALYDREYKTNKCPYANTILTHPRIDLNRGMMLRAGKEINTILSLCMSDWCERESERYPEHAARRKRLARFIPIVLEQGALVSWHYDASYQKQGMYRDIVESDTFKPYYERCHATWQQLESGELLPEELTSMDLGRLASIGKLTEAMRPERWRGHEAQALMLFEALPDWVTSWEPCLTERRHLMLILASPPQTLIDLETLQAAIGQPVITMTDRGRGGI